VPRNQTAIQGQRNKNIRSKIAADERCLKIPPEVGKNSRKGMLGETRRGVCYINAGRRLFRKNRLHEKEGCGKFFIDRRPVSIPTRERTSWREGRYPKIEGERSSPNVRMGGANERIIF